MPKEASSKAGLMKSWISNSKFKKGVYSYSCDGKVIIFVWDASRRFVSKFQLQMTIVVLKFLKNFVLFFKKNPEFETISNVARILSDEIIANFV